MRFRSIVQGRLRYHVEETFQCLWQVSVGTSPLQLSFAYHEHGCLEHSGAPHSTAEHRRKTDHDSARWIQRGQGRRHRPRFNHFFSAGSHPVLKACVSQFPDQNRSQVESCPSGLRPDRCSSCVVVVLTSEFSDILPATLQDESP